MKSFYVSDIRKLLNGRLARGTDDLKVKDAVYYFERMKRKNSLFFLRTKRDIDWDTLKKYVPCAVITDRYFEEFNNIADCTVIMVDDIETAYWTFVDYYRNLFQIPVVAITGTSGKTTTKDMTKHILKYSLNVQGTVRSANAGTIHLSYLLGIDEKTDVAVIETAVSRPGDLTESFRYFKPHIGVMTNIGIDHLDKCKTLEGYIRAKGEMVKLLGDNGTLIVNSDDENIKKAGVKRFKGRLVTFGINSPCDFLATNIKYGKDGMDFVLKHSDVSYQVFVPGYGEHQVYNALAAIATSNELGIGITEATERLLTFEKLQGHLQLKNGIGGCEVLDDTWNINTTSLKAALTVLNTIANRRKKVAIIGSIDDLGDASIDVHQSAGNLIIDMGKLDTLVTVGYGAQEIAKQVLKRGFKGNVKSFYNTEGVYDYLKGILDENTIILAKCSMYHESFIRLVQSLY